MSTESKKWAIQILDIVMLSPEKDKKNGDLFTSLSSAGGNIDQPEAYRLFGADVSERVITTT